MIEQTFKDKRGRDWEVFIDPCYYDMTCVRCTSFKDHKDFNSQLSFHFATSDKAKEFAKLLKESS